ncbi:MAG: TRAP-type mannitol/chloroaromatic compound transport system permease small subunit [Candidatus Azotimanducaceae bacterium]|jgi:TRAP-type mannitol/chloroaromatic compound transport system permease small subunit
MEYGVLQHLFKGLLRLLDQLADLTGKLVAPLLGVMLVATFIVVISRYGFDYGAVKLQESVLYMHATVFMLGFAYTLKQGGHVRVDIVYQRLGVRGQAIVDLVGTSFFLLPMCGFILYASLDYVSFSWQLKEGSAEPGGLPFVYLLKTVIPISAGLLILQGLAELLRNLLRLSESNHD